MKKFNRGLFTARFTLYNSRSLLFWLLFIDVPLYLEIDTTHTYYRILRKFPLGKKKVLTSQWWFGFILQIVFLWFLLSTDISLTDTQQDESNEGWFDFHRFLFWTEKTKLNVRLPSSIFCSSQVNLSISPFPFKHFLSRWLLSTH